MATKPCAECGEPFSPRTSTHRFCSKRCQKREETRRHRAEKRHHCTQSCSHCGKQYRAARYRKDPERKNRYCSIECQAEAKRWRYMAKSVPLPWLDCTDCGKRHIHRGKGARCDGCIACPAGRWYMGWCLRCGDAYLTRNRRGRYCSRRCLHREAEDRRAALKRTAAAERVRRHKVFQRDNWTCQLCGELVDRESKAPEPWSASLDHIVPLAQGGEHSYDNVQLAHFWCNSVKGDQQTKAEWLAA